MKSVDKMVEYHVIAVRFQSIIPRYGHGYGRRFEGGGMWFCTSGNLGHNKDTQFFF